VGQALEKAQEHRRPVLLRQAIQLIVEQPVGVRVGTGLRVGCGKAIEVEPGLGGVAPLPVCDSSSNPPGDPEEPPGGPSAADLSGLPGQGEEHCLRRVLGGVVVVQDTPADPQDEPGVPPDQKLERPGVAVGGEPEQEFVVGRRRGVRPEGGPEVLSG
jgi:hypothetical protein